MKVIENICKNSTAIIQLQRDSSMTRFRKVVKQRNVIFFVFFFNLQYSLKLSFKKCTEKEWEYA